MSQKKRRQTDKAPLPVADRAQDFGMPRQQRDRLLSLYDRDAAQAAEYAEQLVGEYPQNAFLWRVLGNSRLKLGEYEQALQALERADTLVPDDALIANSLARAHYALGDHERALALQQRCVELDPEYARGHFNLAQQLDEAGDTEGALRHLEKAERLGFDKAQVLHHRVSIQSLNFKFDDGLRSLKELLRLAPESASTHTNCGNYYKDMAEFELAEQHYSKALELAPNYVTAYSNLVLSMHYDPKCTHEQIVDIAKQWESRFAPVPQAPERITADTTANKPLRLGLISSGFRFHPVGQMITTALEHLPEDLELYIYSGGRASDPITERIRKASTAWHSVHHLDDRQLADKIREDGIDILIDLAGHGHGTRLGSVCMRPAPLIVKWVGMQISTTGISAFDYFLSDSIETPPGVDPWYVEKIIRMPDDYVCYLPPSYMPAITALPAIGNRHITLGCFNNPAKVNNVLLVEWAKLMHELPDSRLLLKGAQYSSPEVCARIRSVMEEQGIASERLILEGPSRHQELLETYNRVDIALDPWPYSGGLTTCEALMMGVPVVTLPGPTFAGRHSATHLVNAGMPELVVDSWEEYRRRVIELASDLPNLAVIRACLRRVVEASPLCDGERFARHLHTALRSIWQRHCEGKRPAALSLDKEGQAWFEDETQPVVVQRPPVDIAKKVGFDFGVQGKIIALDNGGQLVGDTRFAELQKLDIFATLAFDPSGRLSDIQRLQQRGELHHYPQVALGDGMPATLHLCQDPAMSATLEPLQAERQLPGNRQATQVIGEQQVATLRLDDIEGLESIDWLLLDNLNDSLKVLENGEKALANTLLVQARVNFVPTHDQQPELSPISHWLSRHGFSFYRLNNAQHYSHLPKRDDLIKSQATQLTCADALFVPAEKRMAELTASQRLKLAFVLHTVYGVQDLAFEVIQHVGESTAENYLKAMDYIARDVSLSDRDFGSNIQAIIERVENCTLSSRKPNHGLPGRLVVSLTSYKSRFDTLHLTLRCLLNQSVVPDKLVLWIAEAEKDLLPQEVKDLQEYGLEISFCDDIRSYKKFVPTLKDHPDWFIATADDDIYYREDWLQRLVSAWDGSYETVVAHRAHKIILDKEGLPVDYAKWDWECRADQKPDGLIFPTTGAGALFPPGIFHPDVTLAEKFMKACPDADDVWLYWMFALKGNRAKLSGYAMDLITWPNSQETTLWHGNIYQGGNNKKIRAMIEAYGCPWVISERKSEKIRSLLHAFARPLTFVASNVSSLLKHKDIDVLVAGGSCLLGFDPAGAFSLPAELMGNPNVRILPNSVLGDGQPATLYACQAPQMSSTLHPLAYDQLPPPFRAAAHITRQTPVKTVALDEVPDLEEVDWLRLDEYSDAMTILEHGKTVLGQTLVLQVGINFNNTHQGQTKLSSLIQWASRHGFSFLGLGCLIKNEHPNFRFRFAENVQSADAIFIPCRYRLDLLNIDRLRKLEFIVNELLDVETSLEVRG